MKYAVSIQYGKGKSNLHTFKTTRGLSAFVASLFLKGTKPNFVLISFKEKKK